MVRKTGKEYAVTATFSDGMLIRSLDTDRRASF